MGLKPAWEQRVIRLTREQDDELLKRRRRVRGISEPIWEAVERYLDAELGVDVKQQAEDRE